MMVCVVLSVKALDSGCAAVFQRIQYAKTDSEVISKMKGTYGDKEKKKKEKKNAQELQTNQTKKATLVSLHITGI